MAVHETHISVVIALGERVYKFKKPVSLPFVDLSSPSARRRICERELELNRRLSPDVYIGLAALRGPNGDGDEPAVVMRLLPGERRLATLALGGETLGEEIDQLAATLARFHAQARRSPQVNAAAGPDGVAGNWEANFAEMRPFVGDRLDEALTQEVEALARRYLAGRARLFGRRVADGDACDGHGDLRAEDIFCMPDGPRILDCVEFDDHLRYADVLADVAFLAMDLERLGRPDLASAFLGAYCRHAHTSWPVSLGHHYIAYRAHVRAKVACLQAAEASSDTAEDATALLRLCARHLRRAQVVLALVGGAPATGKSTLARGMAERLGWVLLRSDDVRGEVAAQAGEHKRPSALGTEAYRPELTDATYTALLRPAREALEQGESVVIDASWRQPAHRSDAGELAAAVDAQLVELRCVLDPERAAARAAARPSHDLSDATPELARQLATGFPEWASATELDASLPPRSILDAALAAVDARCGAGTATD
jgi:aminoglycoside phosphotransferase family enzyme/predicted kinase